MAVMERKFSNDHRPRSGRSSGWRLPRRCRWAGVALALFILPFVAACEKSENRHFVTIGTGGVTGVYYVVGGSVCRLVNKSRAAHGIFCAVESTGGSLYNLNLLRRGEIEIGVAQSDWQFHAVSGDVPPFDTKGPDRSLRALFSLHAEPFTVVARADSGIRRFTDLKGRRVNIGNPGSGQRATMEVVMAAMGWTTGDFLLASELKSSEQGQALCDGKVDAIVFTVGHPNGSILEATTSCDAVLVPVEGDVIDRLIANHSYYAAASIPGGLYRGTAHETRTFGVRATLVSRADAEDRAVYEVVKAVFDHLGDFKRLHPSFRSLEPEEMLQAGLSAPLHPGALRYYRERGWR